VSPEYRAVIWAAVTVGVYLAAVRLHRRANAWWSSPLLITWGLCGALIVASRSSYREYLSGTGWLVTLLGPATVAFAIPIHDNRRIILRHWRLLLVGTIVGSAIAFGSAWSLARVFQLSPELQASLLPRSVSTPFAITAAKDLGGFPELTAVFTAVTGIFGATIGELFLSWLPLRSSFARGALLGMGAHGAGVAKARELGEEEGLVASLIMIFAGLFNVGVAAILAHAHFF
jgi:putative effector of murein hydrolase